MTQPQHLEVGGTTGFPLESGARLRPAVLAYQTWGAYDPHAFGGWGNAVLVCHALTANSDAAGWWPGVVGPGAALDPDHLFIVCINVLGGCGGSSGPAPRTAPAEVPTGLRFPQVTVGDMVRAQALLLDKLGVRRLALVCGGSLGGMQTLAWCLLYPQRVARAAVLAAPWASPPMAIAWNEIQRQAILLDPAFDDGDYAPEAGPQRGLSIARMLAITSYRSPVGFQERHGRRRVDPADLAETTSPAPPASAASLAARWGHYATQLPAAHPFQPCFRMETYLHHQGEKLTRRFDANSYLYLTRAMDLWDAGQYVRCESKPVSPHAGADSVYAHGPLGLPYRGCAASAPHLPRVTAVGVDTDILYPAGDVHEIVRRLGALGYGARFQLVESMAGHDAFLIETEQIGAVLRGALASLPDTAATLPNGARRTVAGAPGRRTAEGPL